MSICYAKIHNHFVKCSIFKCYTHNLFLCVFFSDDLWENCNNARIFLDRKVRFFATFAGMVVLYNTLFFPPLDSSGYVCVSVTFWFFFWILMCDALCRDVNLSDFIWYQIFSILKKAGEKKKKIVHPVVIFPMPL